MAPRGLSHRLTGRAALLPSATKYISSGLRPSKIAPILSPNFPDLATPSAFSVSSLPLTAMSMSAASFLEMIRMWPLPLTGVRRQIDGRWERAAE